MPGTLGIARRSWSQLHLHSALQRYCATGVFIVIHVGSTVQKCPPVFSSCDPGGCCWLGTSCSRCQFGATANNGICAGLGNFRCNFPLSTTVKLGTTTTATTSSATPVPTTSSTAPTTPTTTPTTMTTAATSSATPAPTTSSTAPTTPKTTPTTMTTAATSSATPAPTTSSTAPTTPTTTPTTILSETVHGSLVFHISTDGVNNSKAAEFVQEPNATIAMRLAVAELVQVDDIWVHVISVALLTTRRLSSSPFDGFQSYGDSRRMTDYTFTTKSGAQVEFIISVPPNEKSQITATVIKQHLDKQSYQDVSTAINQILKSGILRLAAGYRVKVVGKHCAVVGQKLVPSLAPSQYNKKNIRKLIAVAAIASTIFGIVCFVSIVKCYLLFQRKHTRVLRNSREPVAKEEPATREFVGEGTVEFLSEENLLFPPAVISTECKQRLYEALSGMLDKVEPEVFVSFAIGRRSEDVMNSGPELFYVTAVVRALHGRGIHCYARLPGTNTSDACSALLSGTGAPCKTLVVVETQALYRCRECLEQIHAAQANNIEVAPLRFEAEPVHGYPYWPGINEDDIDGVAMIRSVAQTLRLPSTCLAHSKTVQLVSGFLDAFAIKMQFNMLASETNSAELAVTAVLATPQPSHSGSQLAETAAVEEVKCKTWQKGDIKKERVNRKTTQTFSLYGVVNPDRASARSQNKGRKKKNKNTMPIPKSDLLYGREENQNCKVIKVSQLSDGNPNQQSPPGKPYRQKGKNSQELLKMGEPHPDSNVTSISKISSTQLRESHRNTEMVSLEKPLKNLEVPKPGSDATLFGQPRSRVSDQNRERVQNCKPPAMPRRPRHSSPSTANRTHGIASKDKDARESTETDSRCSPSGQSEAISHAWFQNRESGAVSKSWSKRRRPRPSPISTCNRVHGAAAHDKNTREPAQTALTTSPLESSESGSQVSRSSKERDGISKPRSSQEQPGRSSSSSRRCVNGVAVNDKYTRKTAETGLTTFTSASDGRAGAPCRHVRPHLHSQNWQAARPTKLPVKACTDEPRATKPKSRALRG